MKKAIPYSQALRFRRIIDDNNILHVWLRTLHSLFSYNTMQRIGEIVQKWLTALDNLISLIKPSIPTNETQQKVQQAAEEFKTHIRTVVQTH